MSRRVQVACEAKTGEIYLNDEDPSVVEKMVDYFYKLDDMLSSSTKVSNNPLQSIDTYTPRPDHEDSQKDADQDPSSLFHAQMYTVGEKYRILGLKSLVKEKFEAAVQHI
ncbi:LOW QUALITY PROTEIN: hypothetical protein GX50_08699 [[Emmonsia] crescens]|uniref:Uncharacterized protein n=1 Tax=[Emmonsia] crescens TaxID=73230 RepID=A0A2B7Z5S5_9EURO|nr:LOW QUALITY PROTEIN: hypothetical protein GX50_08699 [Emmonsia crescens]